MYPQDDKCKRENKAREYNIRSVAIIKITYIELHYQRT